MGIWQLPLKAVVRITGYGIYGVRYMVGSGWVEPLLFRGQCVRKPVLETEEDSKTKGRGDPCPQRAREAE